MEAFLAAIITSPIAVNFHLEIHMIPRKPTLLQRSAEGIPTVHGRGGIRPAWCQWEWTQEIVLMDRKWEVRER